MPRHLPGVILSFTRSSFRSLKPQGAPAGNLVRQQIQTSNPTPTSAFFLRMPAPSRSALFQQFQQRFQSSGFPPGLGRAPPLRGSALPTQPRSAGQSIPMKNAPMKMKNAKSVVVPAAATKKMPMRTKTAAVNMARAGAQLQGSKTSGGKMYRMRQLARHTSNEVRVINTRVKVAKQRIANYKRQLSKVARSGRGGSAHVRNKRLVEIVAPKKVGIHSVSVRFNGALGSGARGGGAKMKMAAATSRMTRKIQQMKMATRRAVYREATVMKMRSAVSRMKTAVSRKATARATAAKSKSKIAENFVLLTKTTAHPKVERALVPVGPARAVYRQRTSTNKLAAPRPLNKTQTKRAPASKAPVAKTAGATSTSASSTSQRARMQKLLLSKQMTVNTKQMKRLNTLVRNIETKNAHLRWQAVQILKSALEDTVAGRDKIQSAMLPGAKELTKTELAALKNRASFRRLNSLVRAIERKNKAKGDTERKKIDAFVRRIAGRAAASKPGRKSLLKSKATTSPAKKSVTRTTPTSRSTKKTSASAPGVTTKANGGTGTNQQGRAAIDFLVSRIVAKNLEKHDVQRKFSAIVKQKRIDNLVSRIAAKERRRMSMKMKAASTAPVRTTRAPGGVMKTAARKQTARAEKLRRFDSIARRALQGDKKASAATANKRRKLAIDALVKRIGAKGKERAEIRKRAAAFLRQKKLDNLVHAIVAKNRGKAAAAKAKANQRNILKQKENLSRKIIRFTKKYPSLAGQARAAARVSRFTKPYPTSRAGQSSSVKRKMRMNKYTMSTAAMKMRGLSPTMRMKMRRSPMRMKMRRSPVMRMKMRAPMMKMKMRTPMVSRMKMRSAMRRKMMMRAAMQKKMMRSPRMKMASMRMMKKMRAAANPQQKMARKLTERTARLERLRMRLRHAMRKKIRAMKIREQKSSSAPGGGNAKSSAATLRRKMGRNMGTIMKRRAGPPKMRVAAAPRVAKKRPRALAPTVQRNLTPKLKAQLRAARRRVISLQSKFKQRRAALQRKEVLEAKQVKRVEKEKRLVKMKIALLRKKKNTAMKMRRKRAAKMMAAARRGGGRVGVGRGTSRAREQALDHGFEVRTVVRMPVMLRGARSRTLGRTLVLRSRTPRRARMMRQSMKMMRRPTMRRATGMMRRAAAGEEEDGDTQADRDGSETSSAGPFWSSGLSQASMDALLEGTLTDTDSHSYFLTVDPLTPPDLMKHAGCYYDQGSSKLYFQTETDARDRARNYKSYLAICLVDFTGAEHLLSNAFYPLYFVLSALFVSAICQMLADLLPFDFPHSVMLYSAGLGLSHFALSCPEYELAEAVHVAQNIDPKVIFWVLLPALLYEDSACTNWHVGRRVLPSSLLLALPGAILNTVLTGGVLFFTFGKMFAFSNDSASLVEGSFGNFFAWVAGLWSGANGGEQQATTTADEGAPGVPSSGRSDDAWRGFSFSEALLLGAILSATDPVAVIGALHDLHAPAKLTLLISGEALLNDGSGVLLFLVFFDLAKGIKVFSPVQTTLQFAYLAFGGLLVGLAIFVITLFFLRHNKKAKNYQIGLFVVILGAYGTFFIADHHEIEVSAVLAIVTFGFAMSATGQYSIAESHSHHTVIQFLALISNELIFVLAGVVGYRYSFQANLLFRDWVELLVLYFLVHVTRVIVVVVLYPFLKRSGYGMTFKECVILVFSGLRGAVGLAMAILVESDTSSTVLPLETRARIAFHVSGIALLTICINGTTITPFYHWLTVYDSAQHHSLLLHRALCQAEILSKAQQRHMKQHWFFHNCNFEILDLLIPQLHRLFKNEGDAVASNLGRDNKGQITDKRVQRLMMQLASMLNVEKESRYREKILFASEFASVRGLSLCTQREGLNATDLRTQINAVAQVGARGYSLVLGGGGVVGGGGRRPSAAESNAGGPQLLGGENKNNTVPASSGGGEAAQWQLVNYTASKSRALRRNSTMSLKGTYGGGTQDRGMIQQPGPQAKAGEDYDHFPSSTSKMCWSGKKKNFQFPLKSNASVLQGLRSRLKVDGTTGARADEDTMRMTQAGELDAPATRTTGNNLNQSLEMSDLHKAAANHDICRQISDDSPRTGYNEENENSSIPALERGDSHYLDVLDDLNGNGLDHAGKKYDEQEDHEQALIRAESAARISGTNSNEKENFDIEIDLSKEKSKLHALRDAVKSMEKLSPGISDMDILQAVDEMPAHEPRTLRTIIAFFNSKQKLSAGAETAKLSASSAGGSDADEDGVNSDGVSPAGRNGNRNSVGDMPALPSANQGRDNRGRATKGILHHADRDQRRNSVDDDQDRGSCSGPRTGKRKSVRISLIEAPPSPDESPTAGKNGGTARDSQDGVVVVGKPVRAPTVSSSKGVVLSDFRRYTAPRHSGLIEAASSPPPPTATVPTTSSGVPNAFSTLNVRQAITADIETAAELYQTILDACFAGYSELYELELISELYGRTRWL
eukprot:g5800.t1